MKKVLLAILVVVMVAIGIVGLSACAEDQTLKIVGYTDENGNFVPIQLTDEKYAFAVNKMDTQLRDQVNAVLANKKTEIDAIIAKGFDGSELTKVTPVAKDPAKRAQQLIIATSADFPPFESTSDEVDYYGIDMEIAQLIATELGKELVIENMMFESVVSAVQSGKADLGMAGMTVTSDRLESVNFCTEYYQASQVLVVKSSDKTFDNCKSKADVEKILKTLEGISVGSQSGTTGYDYINDGYEAITAEGYEDAGLAMKDMQNGLVQIVIVDLAPAQLLVKSFNAQVK